jgi:hypothetical protein
MKRKTKKLSSVKKIMLVALSAGLSLLMCTSVLGNESNSNRGMVPPPNQNPRNNVPSQPTNNSEREAHRQNINPSTHPQHIQGPNTPPYRNERGQVWVPNENRGSANFTVHGSQR